MVLKHLLKVLEIQLGSYGERTLVLSSIKAEVLSNNYLPALSSLTSSNPHTRFAFKDPFKSSRFNYIAPTEQLAPPVTERRGPLGPHPSVSGNLAVTTRLPL